MQKYSTRRHELRNVYLAVVVVICIFGCDRSPRSGAGIAVPHKKACNRRLVRLWKAIERYRREHGHWPENYKSPNGYEHSWRVVVAPCCFAGRTAPGCYWDLKRFEYRFDEPWNSQHNLKSVASAVLPMEMVCTSESEWGDYPFTSYLWLVRPGNEDGANEELPPDAVLIIESAYSGIEIAEPKDIRWDDLWVGDSPFGRGKLKSLHPDVVKALTVDGQVIDIPKDIAEDDLLKLLNGTSQVRNEKEVLSKRE